VEEKQEIGISGIDLWFFFEIQKP